MPLTLETSLRKKKTLAFFERFNRPPNGRIFRDLKAPKRMQMHAQTHVYTPSSSVMKKKRPQSDMS
jgi:hypothetical protein